MWFTFYSPRYQCMNGFTSRVVVSSYQYKLEVCQAGGAPEYLYKNLTTRISAHIMTVSSPQQVYPMEDTQVNLRSITSLCFDFACKMGLVDDCWKHHVSYNHPRYWRILIQYWGHPISSVIWNFSMYLVDTDGFLLWGGNYSRDSSQYQFYLKQAVMLEKKGGV